MILAKLLPPLCLLLVLGRRSVTEAYLREFRRRLSHHRTSLNEQTVDENDPPLEPQYTVDIFGDIESKDEELLENMRKARQHVNDGWQSRLFRDNLAGNWEGEFEILCPNVDPEGGIILSKVQAGSIQSTITSSKSAENDEGCDIVCAEQVTLKSVPGQQQTSQQAEVLLNPTQPCLIPSDFRREKGNQLVGNCYTVARYEEGSLLAELGVREKTTLTRVKFLYEKGLSAAVSAEEASAFDLSLVALAIMRGKLVSSDQSKYPGVIPTVPDFEKDQIGKGVYDPQFTGEPYVELRLPGKMSILFPRALKSGAKSALTMEWIGDKMRYQVDRIFSTAEGPEIMTLELTEVTIEDAEIYPAQFRERPPFLP